MATPLHTASHETGHEEGAMRVMSKRHASMSPNDSLHNSLYDPSDSSRNSSLTAPQSRSPQPSPAGDAASQHGIVLDPHAAHEADTSNVATAAATLDHPHRTPWWARERSIPAWDGFDIVYLFAIAGTIGTIYEEILVFVTQGVFENRSGSIITTVNWVYGMGASLMFVCLQRWRKPWQYFTIGALLGGAVEFTLSVIEQYLLGAKSWDYSGTPLNIDGRTSVPVMLVWGLLCTACMCWVFPPVLRLVHRIPRRPRRAIAVSLAAVMLVDLALFVPAIVRYSQRAQGLYFDNGYCRWVDRTFDDSFMHSHYPNMQVKH